jgi:hypothetical protein
MIKLSVLHNPQMLIGPKWGVELTKAHYKGNGVLRDYVRTPGAASGIALLPASSQPHDLI